MEIYLDTINPGGIFSAGSAEFASNHVIDAGNPDQLQVTLAVADGVDCFKGLCWGELIFL